MGKVIDLVERRAALFDERTGDFELNAAWNELLAAADTCWALRDPESLEELQDIVYGLQVIARREWQ